MKIIIAGSGPSVPVPSLPCLLKPECVCDCKRFLEEGATSKNWRNNPCLVVQIPSSNGDRPKNVLIDATKSLRESALKTFIPNNIVYIDYVILSHGHSDAIMGLDDLRCLQFREKNGPPSQRMPVFATKETLQRAKEVFPYVFADFTADDCTRWVSLISSNEFEFFRAFDIEGTRITPFPVFHGGTYISSGFCFGREKFLVYISDVKDISEESWRFLDALVPNVCLFIVDALMPEKEHESHFGKEEALTAARRLRPAKTILIGLGHYWNYEKHSMELQQLQSAESLDVVLGYDGMVLDIPLV